ncbi:hypothetical protein [Loktanella sp. Alg231-35]|uniref:hypothetical protein n=1 Tax=Loktanella sp. Alg231-35 TaxID=1922220 RepID=UPI000D55D33A|nr:hypothetical protein [Loktanella sp. Alg231-35]
MAYFSVELRHGENKQVWIANCEDAELATALALEAPGALPSERVAASHLAGDPPFPVDENSVKQWLP